MQAKVFCITLWAVTTLALASMVVSLWVQNKSLKYKLNTLVAPQFDLNRSKNVAVDSNNIINLPSNERQKMNVFYKKNDSVAYDSVVEGTSIDHSDFKSFYNDDSSTSSENTKRILSENEGEGNKKYRRRNLHSKRPYYYNNHYHHHHHYNGNNYYNQNSNNNNKESIDEDESESFDSSTDDGLDLLENFILRFDSELVGLDDETSKLLSLILDLDETVAIVEKDEEVNDRYPLFSSNNSRRAEENGVVTGNNPLEIQLNIALVTLAEQRGLLSSSNIRISAVNTLLRTSASDLLSEVQGLQLLVKDLSGIIDVFSKENAELSTSLVNLKEQNRILNKNNVQYAASNSELSKMIDELRVRVDDFNTENKFFTERNRELKKIAVDLQNETNRLGVEVTDLTRQRESLESTMGDLSNENKILSESNLNLKKSVGGLQIEVSRLTNTTSRLETVNDELKTVAGFLDETADNLDNSYETVASFLSEQIVAYRISIVDKLEISYMSRLLNWDCGYRDFFGDNDFVSDFDTVVPEDLFEEVTEYVGARVLDDMCLDLSDFRAYLYDLYGIRDNNITNSDQTYTGLKIKMNTIQLVSAVQTYSMTAMDYYFPDKYDSEIYGESTSLTEEDWAIARYDCQNLAKSKKFSKELSPNGNQPIGSD